MLEKGVTPVTTIATATNNCYIRVQGNANNPVMVCVGFWEGLPKVFNKLMELAISELATADVISAGKYIVTI